MTEKRYDFSRAVPFMEKSKLLQVRSKNEDGSEGALLVNLGTPSIASAATAIKLFRRTTISARVASGVVLAPPDPATPVPAKAVGTPAPK